MASTKEFKDYIIDQLRNLNNISVRAMMGEFVFYYKGVVFGGIYDDRFLVKETKTNTKYNLEKVLPYKGGRLMLMVENIDDADYLEALVKDTYNGLTTKQKP